MSTMNAMHQSQQQQQQQQPHQLETAVETTPTPSRAAGWGALRGSVRTAANSPQRPSNKLERDLSPGTTLVHQAQQVQNNILARNRSSQEKRWAAHEYSQQSSPPPPSPEDNTNAYFSHTDRPAQRIRSRVERIEAKMIRREHSREQMEEQQQRGNRATEHGFIARSADSHMERTVLMVLKASSLLRSESSARQTTSVEGIIDQVSETVLT